MEKKLLKSASTNRIVSLCNKHSRIYIMLIHLFNVIYQVSYCAVKCTAQCRRV